jgi:hypothetical protein
MFLLVVFCRMKSAMLKSGLPLYKLPSNFNPARREVIKPYF